MGKKLPAQVKLAVQLLFMQINEVKPTSDVTYTGGWISIPKVLFFYCEFVCPSFSGMVDVGVRALASVYICKMLFRVLN